MFNFFYEKSVKTVAPLIKKYHRVEVSGLENIPGDGKSFIVTPNHCNWFGWDAIIVSSILKDKKIHWVSWSYEWVNPLFDWTVKLFNGILHNNHKKFPYEWICKNILKKGNAVGIFPEGNNNTIDKWYRLRRFLPGCIRLAVMSDVPIIPVAIYGLEEASPIFWAREEEKEPIFWILALPFVLPTKVKVHFGKPFYPDLKKENLSNKQKLYLSAKKLQLEVLKLLKKYRLSAYAE